MEILDTSAAVSVGLDTVTVTVPDVSEATHLLAIVAWPSSNAPTDTVFEEETWAEGSWVTWGENTWHVLAFLEGVTSSLVVLRRTVDSEPGSYVFSFFGAYEEDSHAPIAALLAVAEYVEEEAIATELANVDDETAFVAPDASADAAGDGLLNIYYAVGQAGFASPASEVLQFDGNDNDEFENVVNASLLVTFESVDAAGAVGTREATSLAVRDGIAVTVILPGTGPAAIRVVPELRSTIGLVPVGV